MRNQKVEEQTLRRLTPYNVMRLQNCKSFKFRKGEMYPNIRPPVSQCSPNHTFTLLSSTMEANGCGPIDPTLLEQTTDNPYADSMPKVPKKLIAPPEYPCRDKGRRLHAQVLGDAEMAEKWSKLTPRELIRMHNCKTHVYQKTETYQSIRPPVSRCSVGKTAEWLVDALEDNCCSRLFDMEQDDILDVWKQSPHKHTLSFYGVGPGIPPPEAVVFNKVISKCLDKVNTPKPARETYTSPKLKQKLPSRKTVPCGGLVLNQPLLAVKLSKMPNVKRKLNAKEALDYLYCSRPANAEVTFLDEKRIGLNAALDMERPVAKSRHSLRRKQYYCDLKCGLPENKCTDLEWMKYKASPEPYNEAFKQEMEEMEQDIEPEPKNYDELYDELLTCFEDDTNIDPACELYKRCCWKSTQDGSEDGSGNVPTAGGGCVPGRKPPGKSSSRHSGKEEIEQPDKDGPGKLVPEKDKEKPKVTIDSPDKTDKDKPDKKPGKQRPDKDKTNDDQLEDEDKPDKGKPHKKPAKDKPHKDKDDTTKNDLGKPSKDDKDKGKDTDKDKSKDTDKDKIKDKDKDKSKDKLGYESDDEKGKKPPKKTSKSGDEFVEETTPPAPPIAVPIDVPSKDKITDFFKEKPEGYKKPSKKPSKIWKPPGRKPSNIKKPPKTDEKPAEEPVKDCPCEICEFMRRRFHEPDSPLIIEMKRREKRRQLKEYYRQMCCRQSPQAPQYRAPLHKCDPIECDDTFCLNPKLAEYSDCLDAMYKLQQLLGPKHCIVDNELRFNLEDLKRRICKRFCECL
ncbi:uncharacterized protein LOC133850958 [Drosophila sulfurigaster albostrigata]|uniref:uncharacterized protein LOC133850958 n=1 Tax=Drosophila sulfurigaster albostrigata TaxID=89887 RepID=UPI002D219DD8|nr:uncharacterized protein LOC133850958 [Drosophila sulfurigaster albostrigata]